MPRRKKKDTHLQQEHQHPHSNNIHLSSSSCSSNSGVLVSINKKEKPQQRNAANARERARMRVLSRAFCRLKTTLPWVPADTKLSKLDTLRLASSYILHLKGILRDENNGGGGGPGDDNNSNGNCYNQRRQDDDDTSLLHPAITLTWPFGFNRIGSGGMNGSLVGGIGGGGVEAGSESDDGEMSGSSNCSWEEVRMGLGEGISSRNEVGCVHLEEEQEKEHICSSTTHAHQQHSNILSSSCISPPAGIYHHHHHHHHHDNQTTHLHTPPSYSLQHSSSSCSNSLMASFMV